MENENNSGRNKQLIKGVIIGVLLSVVAGAVFYWGNVAKTSLGSKNARLSRKMEEIVSILDKHYVEGIDYDMLEEGVYEGLVSGVGDRYTSYMPAEDYRAFIETMSGSYAGIGVYVYANTEDRMITVTAPIKGSPGERAGILPNDKIIKVNGADVSGDKIDEAIAMMKGKAGTSVTVTVFRRDTEETLDITVTRENIDVPTVEHKMLENGIGYIAISSFDDNTAEQFKKALSELNADGQKALIIDVRNNLGGYLNRVVEICDMLLSDCTIVYREDKDGNKRYEKATSTESFNAPMAVLINGASASASEILAGALKDNNAAVLVGNTTFGKGLVQQIFRLEDNSAVKVTVERYFTPSGVCINGIGIEPDYEADLPKELQSAVTIESAEDAQLMKAVEVLMEKLGE